MRKQISNFLLKTVQAILTLFFFCLIANAQSKVAFQGWVETGGFQYSASSSVRVQRSYPNSTITVYLTGSTTLANIYSDVNGAVPKSNPFTADSSAFWFLFADTSRSYDIKFSGAGITTPFYIYNQQSNPLDINDYKCAGVNAHAYKASGSAITTTGSISNGQTVLTVASVIDFIIGQGIAIGNAQEYIGTITAISGLNITISPSVSQTFSSVTVQHDDSVAINAAQQAVYNSGGGRVCLTHGTYLVNNVDNVNTNSILYPPMNLWTGSALTSVSISLEGEEPPSWGDFQVLGSGTIIKSTKAGSGNFPAILSGRIWSAVSAGNQHLYWNYVPYNVENILFRTKDNPTRGCINFFKINRASGRNIICDIGVRETTPSSTTASNPTSNIIGIAFPQAESNGLSFLENIVVTGYRTGIYISDHTRTSGFIMAARCLTGLQLENMAGMGIIEYYSYRNKKAFDISGTTTSNFWMIYMDEVDSTSGTWTQRSIGIDPDFTDNSNFGVGRLYFKLESPSGLQDYAPTYTGMGRVRLEPYTNVVTGLEYTRNAPQTVTNNVETNILWNTELTVGGNYFTHSTSVNAQNITFNLTGFYCVDTRVVTTVTGTGADNGVGRRVINLKINGTIVDFDERVPFATVGTPLKTRVCRLFVKGDVVSATLFHTAGVNLDIYSTAPILPRFEVIRGGN